LDQGGENFGARSAGYDSFAKDQSLAGDTMRSRVLAAAMRLAAYSDEFLQQIRGKRFRNRQTGNDVLFVSLPPVEQARVYEQWARSNAPEGLRVDPNCPDCKGTGWYTGFREKKPCPTCVKRQQESGSDGGGGDAAEREREAWSEAGVAAKAGMEPPKALVDMMGEKYRGEDPDDYSGDGGWDAVYDDVLDELSDNEHSPFSGASPDLDTDDEAEHDEAEEKFHEARGWTKKITDKIHDDLMERLGEAEEAYREEVYQERVREEEEEEREQAERDRQEAEKESFTMDRAATYPDDFMQLVQGRKFRQPSTGNRVEFVSLLPEEQAKIYSNYQRNVAARAEKEKAERARLRRRPTFAKAKEQVFDKLDESGWETRRGLKVPKAIKTEGENQIILHFKPQAVWMEVRGRERVPARSLHVDLRDVAGDPAAWIEGLAKEAEDAVKSEAEMNAPYRGAAQESLKMMKNEIAARVAERHANTDDFHREMGRRKFRNPATGNQVSFRSLPPEVQNQIHKQWEATQAQRTRAPASEEEAMVRRMEERGDPSGMGHDDVRSRYSELSSEAGMEGWSFLPQKGKGEPTIMLLPAGPGREKGVPQVKRPTDPDAPEPPPPAEVKRQLAERMRDVGRSLMVSGMRAPRQQMMEIGKALDILIDQLELLADQPNRKAFKRRIMLGLRNRVLTGR
jgi:hypothetical protein